MKTIRIVLSALLALQAGAASPGLAEEPAAAPPSAEETKARGLLDSMAKHLAAAEQFGVEIDVGYEVVQENGQKIEFGEEREVAVARPDKLRVDSEHGDGTEGVTLFDGKQITLYDSAANVYVTAAQKGDLDASVIRFVRDLKMRLPLAPLVMKTLPDELARRVETVDYVEATTIDDNAVHHIAGRTPTVDFEMWIDAGKEPLLHRMAITYREAEGQPRFRAEFEDWDLDPGFGKSKFKFDAPKGAKGMPFAAELVAAAAAVAAEDAASGEPAKGGAK